MCSLTLQFFIISELGVGVKMCESPALSCLMTHSPQTKGSKYSPKFRRWIWILAWWSRWRVRETDRWHFRRPNPVHAGIASSPLGEWHARQRKRVNGGINVNYVNGLIEKGLAPACASAQASTASVKTRVGNKRWQMEWPLDIINKP